MHNRGKITDKGLAKSIKDGDRELIIHALALKAEIDTPVTRKILLSRDGKTITALAWKAGLNMRTALDLQRKVAHVPPAKVINARDGVDYSLSEDEMSWFLEFFCRLERISIRSSRLLSLTAAALRSAACAGAPQVRRVAVAPVAPRPNSKKHTWYRRH